MLFIRSFSPFDGMALIMDEKSYHGCTFIRWMLRRQPQEEAYACNGSARRA
jgi:hypothetical protein